MVWDILRFNSAAIDELRKGDRGESIGDLLRRNGYSDSFTDNYLLVSFLPFLRYSSIFVNSGYASSFHLIEY